jgi:acylpyruvate hydrolase
MFSFLARFTLAAEARGARPRFGLTDGRVFRDLSSGDSDWSSFVAACHADFSAIEERSAAAPAHAAEDVVLLPPVDDAARIFCVALNYRSHVVEMKRAIPRAPVIFVKPVSAVVAGGAPIGGLQIASFLDYEAELAVVIGAPASAIGEADAPAVVMGATLFNDVTGRDLMFIDPSDRTMPDWFSAKSLDGSSPMGPWILPRARGGDPEALAFEMALNGEIVQRGAPDDKIFSTAYLISYVSQRVALRPGDVIATGTPTGTGKGRGVPLKAGDRLAVTCREIGRLDNQVR